ncbi:MAG: outer membrane beta-barrel protein [Wolinella sp.]
MNFSRSLLFAMFLSGSLLAHEESESGFYLGVGLDLLNSTSHTTIDLPIGYSLTQNLDREKKVQRPGINIGYRFTPNHRVYFEYRTFEREFALKEREISMWLFGYAYTPKFSDNWRALLGANVGSTSMTDDYNHEISAITVGFKLGMILELAKHHEIELGFRHDRVKFDVDFIGGAPQTIIAYGTQELKYSGFFMGYNYKF